MVDMSVKIGSVTLKNPIMPASGCFSTDLAQVIDLNRLGALVAKTVSREFRAGNPPPRVSEVEGGMINSIGLPTKGIEYFLTQQVPDYKRFTPPLVGSISATTIEDFEAMARDVSTSNIDVLEVNISCPTRDPKGRVHTMCHAVPGKWCVFGCMLSAGGSFQWFRNQLGQNEVALAKKKRVDPYELLIAQAEQAPPGCEGLFFLPYLTGERCPHPDPSARGGWIGITARTTREMLIRSLVEGVTFGMRDALEIMRGMGVGVTQVRASGGGARSAFWRQLQADVYKSPLVLTNASEGPAYGVALLAGVGTGVWSSVEEACKRAIKQTQKIAPKAKMSTVYDRHYAVYDELYGDLKDRFSEMATLA